MAKKKRRFNFFVLILFIPIGMLLTWFMWPKKKMVVAMIDKTVLTTEGQEHASLTWVLNNDRYTKTSSKIYNVASDYYGFFPKDSNRYDLKGMERLSSSQIQKLSNDADVVYFTDAYGIYSKEWFGKENVSERSGLLYGGLHKNDVELMRLAKQQKKW